MAIEITLINFLLINLIPNTSLALQVEWNYFKNLRIFQLQVGSIDSLFSVMLCKEMRYMFLC